MKFTTANLTRPSLEHFSGTPEGFTLNDAKNICAKIKSLGQDERYVDGDSWGGY